MGLGYVIRVSVTGHAEKIAVLAQVPEETLCGLLETDVTERMRVPVMPEAFENEGFVLCYYIDARGGEKALPSNALGTCFYHTGCPIFGDLLLAACPPSHEDDRVSAFTEQQADLLLDWLRTQFPAYVQPELS